MSVLGAPAWADARAGIEAFERGDYAVAVRELVPLARANDAEAQYFVGAMYEAGLGVEQDLLEANQWYTSAAQAGLAMAQFHLGLMYETGQGIGRNYEKSAKWYHRAAEQGHAPAQGNLGRLYLTGQGVGRDLFQSYFWSSVAVNQGYLAAKRIGKRAASQLSSEDISRAQKLVREWVRKSGRN